MQMETLPAGTILHGRYRVERALGSGGFGHVYLSVDLQTNAQYAIKEYLVTGASGKAQLEHEAQVLSHLHHPNLPALLTAFDERGHYYVVLGYIEGNDLTDYIRVVRQKNEVIPLARLMEWILSICDAVAFLHSQRPPIIHRDIKPDNIRITPSGTAILVDLGNAKTAADGARTLFFIRHQGTPGYAPLEQYPGGTGTDERSDIYALGGTLYFALTAHEPPSVSARNQALQQKQPDLPSLQDRLAQNPPDIPQEPRQFRLGVSKPAKPAPRHSRHLAQLGMLPPDVLRKLDAIIQRAMAMKPKDRYQSVADFSRDLRMVLKALPASTIPPVTSGRPVDPHSTQPDLPMLYEAMQNAQAAGQPSQPAPSQQPAPVVARCPRCGAELNRPAPYCPRCGSPLSSSASAAKNQTPNQSSPQSSPAQDIADEATMLISPSQEPADRARLPGSSSAQAMQQVGSFLTLPPASARQQMVKTPSQPIPSVQSPTPAPKPLARPAQGGTNNNVKPFFTSASLNSPNSQAQVHMAGGSNPPASSGPPKKLFVTLAIVIVALILVMLILLVFLQGHHHLLFQGPTRSSLLHAQSVIEQAKWS
jgi:serine/threonine protein kinase